MSDDFKTKAIRDYLEAQIGSPIVNALDKELGAIQSSINLALITYWQAFPWTIMKSYDSVMRGQIDINIAQLMQEVFTNQTVRDQAYYLGITRLDENMGGIAGGVNIDSYLLGVPVYSSYFYSFAGSPGHVNPSLDVAQLIRYKTEVGIMMGQPEVSYDNVAGVVTVLTPSAFAQLTVWFGFGFTEQSGITYMRNNQLGLFRKICGFEFLNILLNARNQIKLNNADFQIDAATMTKRRDELKTEVEQGIKNEVYTPLGWG